MSKNCPYWIRVVLIAAAIYNLFWGAWVVFRPTDLFDLMQIDPPNYVPVWQALGMVVGVYGIGYAIASEDPVQHWLIVLVGLTGKVLGAIGFTVSYYNGSIFGQFFWQILLNDLVWVAPFMGILYYVYREHSAPKGFVKSPEPIDDGRDPITVIESQLGQTIHMIAQRRPLMLIFLRQSGCSFCRQTLSDLQTRRDEILDLGIEVAIVHMGRPMEGTMMLSNYDLDFFHRFSDPTCRLYRRFGFERGRFNQLFSPKILWRGIKAGLFGGHGIGAPKGDGFQLPGVVVMYREKAILAFPAEDASERFDYFEIAKRAMSVAASIDTMAPRKEAIFN